MKTINISFLRSWLLFPAVLLSMVMRAQTLSFPQADSLLAVNNHDLRSARWNVTAAEEQLA